jgi:FAD/FMN-containing dehydrogenase
VAAVLTACREAGVAVVPQGGNTGLVGGSVPLHGEVVLSLRRLDDLGEVDPAAAQVTVGAGVTLDRLHTHAAAADLAFGVDLGARESATVGGMIATNAGGLHFLRYGGMRDQVLGLEAVLADGSVVRHLDGLWKDNTGYDWGRLLCGSEGTLAVVTAARLRLVPAESERALALLAFDDVASAVDAVWSLRANVESLSAAELFLGAGLELVCDRLDLPKPFPRVHPAYLLVECAGRHDPTDELAEAVSALATVLDVAVADRGRYQLLWWYRERHTEAINLLGPPHKLDVTLPAARIAEFVDAVPGVVEAADPSARCWLFGHVADGNIHVNITGPAPDDEATDEAVLARVAALGGSISAEHGIGTAKKAWLHLNRSPAEVRLFRSIKAALDPSGLLNPHVLLP